MLRMKGITKRFGAIQALADLTMEVPAGSVFALVGPNGAGKTTAVKISLNILRPTAGSAQVLGVESPKLGPNELAQIGYMSENRQLPDWMPVRYFFAYCREFYPTWRDEYIAALMPAFELPLAWPLTALPRSI